MVLRKRIGVIMYQTSKSKGQELVAQRMVREFIRLGQEAFLISSVYNDGIEVVSSENLRKIGGYILAEDKDLGIPVIRVDSYIARWPPRRIVFRDFIPILERIVDEFRLDVLITHSTLWNGPEEVAKFMEWRRYMRGVGGYQDPLLFCHMSHFQEPSPKRYSLTERSFRLAWNKLVLPQIFSTANLILVVTPLEKEAKVRRGAKGDRCFLFPGGVDDEAFLRYANTNARSLLGRLKVTEKTKIVSYVGSLEERKNPAAVLKIAEELRSRKDVHFVIAGRDDSSYAKEVIEKAENLPNVTYLGEVTDEEKIQLIKVSYLNIIMSRLEALGLVQLEFMYAGVPVVTSAVGGQAWLVRDGIDGIHLNGPDDVEGGVEAITKLIDDPGLRDELSTNAKKRATPMAISRLTSELDKALSEGLIKERGLTGVPGEVRVTMAEPESVLRSWSSGSWGVIATGKRLFIRMGVISRKVTEIPYANITSIEHTRRYVWKTLAVGSVISLLLFIEPSLRPILSSSFLSRLGEFVSLIFPEAFLQSPAVRILLEIFPTIPFLLALVVFAVEARTGFTLRGPGIEPLYLPSEFREAIAFVRSAQDGRLSQEQGKGDHQVVEKIPFKGQRTSEEVV